MKKQNRSINIIASEVAVCWGEKVSPYALPYLEAMLYLEDINDFYGADSARSIILYFLTNAGGFRGNDARRLKKELKALLSKRKNKKY